MHARRAQTNGTDYRLQSLVLMNLIVAIHKEIPEPVYIASGRIESNIAYASFFWVGLGIS